MAAGQSFIPPWKRIPAKRKLGIGKVRQYRTADIFSLWLAIFSEASPICAVRRVNIRIWLARLKVDTPSAKR